MFVQGPPVFVKISVTEEESTSVFVSNVDFDENTDHGQVEQVELLAESPVAVANPSVRRRIMYLGSSFPRQVYRPLKFILEDETVTGTINKIEGETVLIETDTVESEIVAIELGKIEEILWRGDPFVEN